MSKIQPLSVRATSPLGGGKCTAILDTGDVDKTVGGATITVEIWVTSDQAQTTFQIYGSIDGEDWKPTTTLTTTGGNPTNSQSFPNGFRHIKVEAPAPGNHEIIVAAAGGV